MKEHFEMFVRRTATTTDRFDLCIS